VPVHPTESLMASRRSVKNVAARYYKAIINMELNQDPSVYPNPV